jgi:hypothetical protein
MNILITPPQHSIPTHSSKEIFSILSTDKRKKFSINSIKYVNLNNSPADKGDSIKIIKMGDGNAPSWKLANSEWKMFSAVLAISSRCEGTPFTFTLHLDPKYQRYLLANNFTSFVRDLKSTFDPYTPSKSMLCFGIHSYVSESKHRQGENLHIHGTVNLLDNANIKELENELKKKFARTLKKEHFLVSTSQPTLSLWNSRSAKTPQLGHGTC